jgi:hypothetical protein
MIFFSGEFPYERGEENGIVKNPHRGCHGGISGGTQ